MNKLKGMSRYLICGIIFVVVMFVYLLRLADWQIVKGDEFLEQANQTTSVKVKMDAARGEIVDTNGVALAANKTGYAIVFDRAYMTRGTENNTILTLIRLLEGRGEEWTDELPITLDANGTYQFIEGMDKEIAALKSKNFLNVNSYTTAEECMAWLAGEDWYNVTGLSREETLKVVSVRYNMTKSGFSVSTPYTFAPDVSIDTVSIIRERSQTMPGVSVKITTVRNYGEPTLMPHILGRYSSITAEEYEQKKDEGYAYNDLIGHGGIEGAFEDELRGESGEKVVETTSKGGTASETVTKAPVSGNTVYLTLDSRIQKVAMTSLAKNVQELQKNAKAQAAAGKSNVGEDCLGGGAVLIRLSDFAVLAAATYPTYDITKLTDPTYLASLNTDPATPLINRAFNAAYEPGSCFKPAVASAALQEGVITNTTSINCKHWYERFAPSYRPTCLHWHGPTTLSKALAQSCNVYFFETGYQLGITNMNLYCKRFGLGEATGIEIGESTGNLASPESREASGQTWVGGDTIQAAIGQSDNLFTTLQLATYVSTLANDGVRLKTHIVDKITDYSRQNILFQTETEQLDDVGVSKENFALVKAGMRQVISSPQGTAYSVFKNYSIPVAGKTGTAQTNTSDNVSFIGFAPYDNPEVAVAVMLEHGSNGRYSMQVAKDLLDAYFYGTSVDESGNIVFPSANGDGASSGTASQAQ